MSKNEDYEKFREILINTGSFISREYFQVTTAGNKNKITRERVYCYELYHCLRLNNEYNNKEYKLDAEMHKGGHSIIDEFKDLYRVMPDFIVHKRGCMNKNLVVIEVKPAETSVKSTKQNNSIEDDLTKLDAFINKAGYYKGIMLIYGEINNNTNKIIKVKNKIREYENENLELIWHRKPEYEMEHLVSWIIHNQSLK